MQIGARFLMASFIVVLSGAPSWSDDPPPPLTQNHVNSITETAAAPGQATKAEPPKSINPLSEEDRATLKGTNRVYKGKDWKAISPQERDNVIRGLRDNNAAGSIFVIDVRTGDIYKFDPLPPPIDPNKTEDARLSDQYRVGIRFFTEQDLLDLKVAVGERPFSQSDRSSKPVDVGRVRLDF